MCNPGRTETGDTRDYTLLSVTIMRLVHEIPVLKLIKCKRDRSSGRQVYLVAPRTWQNSSTSQCNVAEVFIL